MSHPDCGELLGDLRTPLLGVGGFRDLSVWEVNPAPLVVPLSAPPFLTREGWARFENDALIINQEQGVAMEIPSGDFSYRIRIKEDIGTGAVGANGLQVERQAIVGFRGNQDLGVAPAPAANVDLATGPLYAVAGGGVGSGGYLTKYKIAWRHPAVSIRGAVWGFNTDFTLPFVDTEHDLYVSRDGQNIWLLMAHKDTVPKPFTGGSPSFPYAVGYSGAGLLTISVVCRVAPCPAGSLDWKIRKLPNDWLPFPRVSGV